MYKFIFYFLWLLIMVSCNNSSETAKTPQKPKEQKKEIFSLASPTNGSTFKTGEVFSVNIKSDEPVNFDSCVLNIDGKYYQTLKTLPAEITVSAIKVGIRRMLLNVYSQNEIISAVPFAIKVVPANAPAQYTYRVKKEYPHDTQAYTQGLFYWDSYIYEGTGQEGHSSLRKVELQTGKVIQQHKLDDKYFGEGICLLNGKIYQLTWRHGEGFVYNLEDFSPAGKFNYSSEGWGLTTDGTVFWMSDGTSNLYKLNPANMSVIDILEVSTNKGLQKNLNELEYIDGKIWANVYLTDTIVIIDPQTGEVMGEINLKNILNKALRKPDTDVLNGIAYDEINKRIFVTGKNWARLFEIEVVKK